MLRLSQTVVGGSGVVRPGTGHELHGVLTGRGEGPAEKVPVYPVVQQERCRQEADRGGDVLAVEQDLQLVPADAVLLDSCSAGIDEHHIDVTATVESGQFQHAVVEGGNQIRGRRGIRR